MHLSTDNLIACCESLCVRGSWAVAAAKIGCAESTLYLWLTKSKRAQQHNEGEASPFWLRWREHDDFWHEHVKRARKENVMALSFLVMDQCRNGIDVPLINPSTMQPVYQLDPAFLGVSDDDMRDQLLDPVRDRWLWNYNEAGGRTTPKVVTRTEQIPASLRAKVLAGLLPQTFGERAQIDHRVQGAVVHIMEPPKYIPHSQREQQAEVIEGQFTEVCDALPAPERADIAALRAEAERLMREGPRNPKPDAPVQVLGRGDGDAKPTRENVAPPRPESQPLSAHPRAYSVERAPEPRPKPPAYPVPGRDRCMKVG